MRFFCKIFHYPILNGRKRCEKRMSINPPPSPPSITAPPVLSYSSTVKLRLLHRNQLRLQKQSACEAKDFGWDSWSRKPLVLSRSMCCTCNTVYVSCLSMHCWTELFFILMKRLKTPLWSTMSDERLSFLAILHIHKHKDVDIDGVVTGFTRLKGRRLAFCLWTVNNSVTIFLFLCHSVALPKTLIQLADR